MTATRKDIEGWLAEGQRLGATHVIVMHDHYDHDNYPVYVQPGQDAMTIIREKTKNMQSHDECYDLRMDIPAQLAEYRARHY